MQNISELAEQVINQESIISAVFSGIQKKAIKTFNKVTIKKVTIQNEVKHQFEYFYDKNVEHKNFNSDETTAEIINLLETYLKQALINTINSDYHVLINKKGEAKINKKAPTKK